MTLYLFDLTAALTTVRQCSEQLTSDEQCSKALAVMGSAIAERQDDILEANTLDLEISRVMAVPELVVDWLKLTPERVQVTANIFQRLAAIASLLFIFLRTIRRALSQQLMTAANCPRDRGDGGDHEKLQQKLSYS